MKRLASLTIALLLTIGSHAWAGGKGGVPAATSHNFRAQGKVAKRLFRQMHRLGLPQRMVTAAQRIVTKGQDQTTKLNSTKKVRGKEKLTTSTTGTMGDNLLSSIATRGNLTVRNRVSTEKGTTQFHTSVTAPVGKDGVSGSGESLTVRKDSIVHAEWKTNTDGSKVQVYRQALPAAGGDVIVKTTTTTTNAKGKAVEKTTYTGHTMQGAIEYKVDAKRFNRMASKAPHVFPVEL